MRQLFIILRKYAAPYKLQIAGNIFFNFLYSVANVFSLALVIPFLGILFGTQERVLKKPDLTFSIDSFSDYFNYEVTKIIETQGELKALMYVSLFVLGAIFLKNIFTYTANILMAYMRNAIVRDMRGKMYKKFLELPLSYYSSTQKGQLISRITNDVQAVEFSVMAVLQFLFKNPISIIVFLIALFNISAKLTLVIFGLLMAVGALIGWLGKTLKKYSARTQQKIAEALAIIEETLGGLRIVKAFSAEKQVAARFDTVNDQHFRLMFKTIMRTAMASPMSEILGVAVMVALMNYGGILVLGGESELKPETFIGYIAIFSQLIEPAKSFSRSYYSMQRGLASYDRVEEVLREPNLIEDNQGSKEITNFKGNVEFKQVSFAYEEEEVLKNIDLKIEYGKTIALVGQSGSGKSTLVDLIPRFYDVNKGDVLVDGISVKELKLSALRGLIGFVNQESILFNDTIFNNIAFGVKNATPEAVEQAARVANAHDFIMETPEGYQTNIGDRGNKLSGGQRQRISIARAILKNPPLLILDEATSALDTESERLVQDALNNLMKNRTSIVIAHRLSTVKMADEICVLQEGEIVERGKHDELIELDRVYKKLYDMQTL